MKTGTGRWDWNVKGDQAKGIHGDWCSHCKHYNEKTFRKSDCVCLCHDQSGYGGVYLPLNNTELRYKRLLQDFDLLLKKLKRKQKQITAIRDKLGITDKK